MPSKMPARTPPEMRERPASSASNGIMSLISTLARRHRLHDDLEPMHQVMLMAYSMSHPSVAKLAAIG
jgi:hypothetical protein